MILEQYLKPLEPKTEEEPVEKLKGMNTKRKFQFTADSEYRLCQATSTGKECVKKNCRAGHDLEEYLKTQLPDIGDECPNYDAFGECPFGVRCRFHKAHGLPKEQQPNNETLTVEQEVKYQLQKKRYVFERSVECLKLLPSNKATVEQIDQAIGCIDVEERNRKIDFRGKSYLAPLTTVGNLPFRRVCKGFGVDITCGEMAMAENLLQGQNSEWALLKRHRSEDLFGVQICGNHADIMSRTVEVINQHVSCDFIDLNMGCPIDFVYNSGRGSGMQNRPQKMLSTIAAMSYTSNQIPVTVKFRTGIERDVNIAHTFIEGYKRAGVALCTMHGRSRQQRYTKLADWEYIDQVGKKCRELDMPFFGNGDLMSYTELDDHLKNVTVDGVMVGRAGLVKPWIFTELKEKRHWDISSSERFDMMKTFVDYGLQHWGSDTQGVNKTRLYLLEWQSFMCRYVPVGLLEHVPQTMNQKPPQFYGRDELETLMGSDKSSDWIKLTDMLLGKANEDFKFVPKHKSASY